MSTIVRGFLSALLSVLMSAQREMWDLMQLDKLVYDEL